MTAIYQIIFGELLVGAAIGVSFLAIIMPAIFTRNRIKSLPLEFEIILFTMVVLQFVIGETLNFYDKVPYYDKLVHFSIPFFLGYIIAMLAYTMIVTDNLRVRTVPAIIIIILVTLGIGAAWEIVEYFSDNVLGTYLQGSLTGSPLTDTMNDLIADTLGGVFGSLLALRFIRSKNLERQARVESLTTEISENFSPNLAKKRHL